MKRTFSILALAAASCAALAGPAQAANQTVVVGHDEFLPTRVAVKPGESVIWDNTAGHDHDQHNVRFEDGSFRDPNPPAPPPWTTARSFSTAGAYRYYCEVHGAPGGVGMSGIVYVNDAGNVPPAAAFTVAPAPVARTGEPVSFDASTSDDPDGTVAGYEWDLDGNGSYETATAGPTTSRTYSSSATLTVGLRVTDNNGTVSEAATRTLRVTTPPTAAFTVGPNPATTGQMVTFNGSPSNDADGALTNYEWDLDGDGTYETGTGSSPTATRAYMTPATVTVRLRVTDSDGVKAETGRTLTVSAPLVAPPGTVPTPQAPAPGTQPAGCGALRGSQRAACMQRACRSVARRRRASCIQRSCRYVKRGARRAACVRKSCRTLTGRTKLACLRKSCRTLKGAQKRSCARRYAARSSRTG